MAWVSCDILDGMLCQILGLGDAVKKSVVTLMACVLLNASPAEAPVPLYKERPTIEMSRSSTRSLVGLDVRSMTVTAYTLAECGKSPDHPKYGITASGEKVQQWKTVASTPDLPFGTVIYIDAFKDMPNGGVFEVQDRGGAVKGIDVYVEDVLVANQLGKQTLEVVILKRRD